MKHGQKNAKDETAHNVVKNYKDTVFRMLFTNSEYALNLYNVLNGTDYCNPQELEYNTLENAIYMNVKNDLSFVVAHCVNPYEHQSTINPNMPLRDLFYVADVLQKLVKDKSLYSSKVIRIPNPAFVVFYNGMREAPERFEMKLSDLFEIPTNSPALELKVTFLNINQGMNQELMERCQVLKEYAVYVAMVREYAKSMTIEEAVVAAVNRCIEENVLKEFLLKQKAEVIKVSIYEYDEERELTIIREDERELGREQGIEQGIEQGDAQRLIKSVENVMKSLCVSIGEACNVLGASMEEYEQAKAGLSK